MEEFTYNNVSGVLQLNKAGELIQKRMKAAKVCDGLYVTEPDASGYTQFICELNGVVWLDCKAAARRIADGAKIMPGYFEKIKSGIFDDENAQMFKREISRRINRPDAPEIMGLKHPERKKPAQLADDEKRVSVFMFKGCTDEKIDKKVIIKEVAPHIYTHVYKLRRYGERVKIIFEIDGVYFQGADEGAYVMKIDNFAEICRKAYDHARENIADGAAKGMAYFVELTNRLNVEITTEAEQADEAWRADIETKRAEAEKWRETVAIREQQRKEAEERRKAELLADGKEKLMANKAVTVEQIEVLAEAVGYKIHIRTIGFMREKISEAVLNTDETVTVWGRKLTSRNISGTADVLREIAARIKTQTEAEARQPATAAETPQISTESAETVNVSGESEMREISRLITFYGFRFSTAPNNGNLWRLYNNSEPITDYMTISQLLKYLRAYSHKQVTSNKPQMPIFAPQPRKIFPTANYATPIPKAREIARKRHCRRLGANGYTMLDDAAAALAAINTPRHLTANSPPTGRPQLTPYW